MTSTALIIGDFADRTREELSQAAVKSSVAVHFCPTVQRALTRLRAGQELPMCVVVDGELNVRQLVDAIRDGAESFAIPVLVLLSRPVTSAYRDAYLAGADDVLCVTDDASLTRRFSNLGLHRADIRPAATLGRAVIASRDGASRRRLGRTLRQVGFDVAYASDLDEFARTGQGEQPAAFVVSTEPANPALGVVHEPGSSNVGLIGETPVLFLDPRPEDMPTRTGDQVADITGRLLFFADEQAKAKFKDRRASPRELYWTICSFREGGLVQPIYGVTHNISREGMYVRTFDPPVAKSRVWLEVCPPASDTAVQLRATVMWQRLPGSGKGVLPPGFGLCVDAGECSPVDLARFAKGYQTLLD
jgi:CheY-like chemotaxis protein